MKFFNDIKSSNNNVLDIKKLGFEITNTDLPLEVGETKYDPDAQTLVTQITENDVLRHGQELLAQVRNQTGATIPKGRAVYVSGGIAQSPIVLVAPASNTNSIEARRVIGLTTTDIPNNSFGKVVTSGVVQDLALPSNEWEVGDCVYLTTNGEYSNVPPAKGIIVVRIGTVIRVGNDTGAIFLFARLNPFLSMLSDIDISDPENGEVLTYDSNLGIWVNQSFTVNAENVAFNNTNTGIISENAQAAIEQLLLWSQFFTIEIDGRISSSEYQGSPILNGGSSDTEHNKSVDSGDSNLKYKIIDGGSPYSSH